MGKFKKLFVEQNYKPLKNYTKEDIISLIPKDLINYLSFNIGIENINFEIPSNNIISISFLKSENPINSIYFKNIRWKEHSNKDEYRYLLSIKTNLKNIEKIEKESDKKYDEIIEILRKKGHIGTIDRLKRGIITIKDAENELKGKFNIDDNDPRKMNPRDIARIIKKSNIDRQSSYSQYVKFMSLKPKIDAKKWFKIWDEI